MARRSNRSFERGRVAAGAGLIEDVEFRFRVDRGPLYSRPLGKAPGDYEAWSILPVLKTGGQTLAESNVEGDYRILLFRDGAGTLPDPLPGLLDYVKLDGSWFRVTEFDRAEDGTLEIFAGETAYQDPPAERAPDP